MYMFVRKTHSLLNEIIPQEEQNDGTFRSHFFVAEERRRKIRFHFACVAVCSSDV